MSDAQNCESEKSDGKKKNTQDYRALLPALLRLLYLNKKGQSGAYGTMKHADFSNSILVIARHCRCVSGTCLVLLTLQRKLLQPFIII